MGGGQRASMMGTGGQKSEQPHVNLKIKVGALKVSKQVLFQEDHLILDWHVLPCSTMFYHVLPCETMFCEMSSVLNCVNSFAKNE